MLECGFDKSFSFLLLYDITHNMCKNYSQIMPPIPKSLVQRTFNQSINYTPSQHSSSISVTTVNPPHQIMCIVSIAVRKEFNDDLGAISISPPLVTYSTGKAWMQLF